MRDEHGPVHGRDTEAIYAAMPARRGPERLLDIMLRTGPYGDGFGVDPDGLSLAVLEAQSARGRPRRIGARPDPDMLRTPSGKIEAFPDADRVDLRAPRCIARSRVGRARWCSSAGAHVRSNNSWMHNIRVLTKGRNRCTLQIHPDDAVRLGLDRRRAGQRRFAGRRGRARRRGHRRDPARRREHPARIRPEPARRAAATWRRSTAGSTRTSSPTISSTTDQRQHRVQRCAGQRRAGNRMNS